MKESDLAAGIGMCIIVIPGLSAALLAQKHLELGIALAMILGVGVTGMTYGLIELMINPDRDKPNRNV